MLTINKLVLTNIYKTLYSMTAEFYVQAKMKHLSKNTIKPEINKKKRTRKSHTWELNTIFIKPMGQREMTTELRKQSELVDELT